MKNKYKGDNRYEEVYKKMLLLNIKDVSTTRQEKNGTIVWKLPIKNHDNRNPSYIKVASFSTGYVRNQNSGYSNYQLNKRCEGQPEYFELDNGDFRKFTTRSCVLIPIEIDRLEYLISYCLKNYYIKRANQVVEGKYVSQWYHDWSLERANGTYGNNVGAMARMNDMEEKLDAMTEDRDNKSDRVYELESQVDVADTRVINLNLQNEVLQNKLATINRISDNG